MDREKIEKDWRSRGYSCEVWTDPPGKVWEDYVHETDELLMLIEGEIILEMEGQTFRPKPGEEFYIPAGTLHTVKNTGKTQNRWLYGYKH